MKTNVSARQINSNDSNPYHKLDTVCRWILTENKRKYIKLLTKTLGRGFLYCQVNPVEKVLTSVQSLD